MKKIMSAILAGTMALSLTACGTSKPAETTAAATTAAATEAATEAKELVLRDVIDLSLHISALENILIHAGDPTLAEVAGQKATKLRELFELWLGFDTAELVIKAIENKDANGEIEQLCKLVSSDRIDDPISSCPLFAEVVLGGKPRGEGTTADAMTDLKNTIAKLD